MTTASTQSAPGEPRFVVGVGASAGGLQAFRELLRALPSDTGMSWLLVQHLDPSHESLLSELLSSDTDMPVVDADQGAPIAPDTVYVIRPGTALGVKEGRIELGVPTIHRGARLVVDHLFRSLAEGYGSRAIAVVLSGAGSDGAAGLRHVQAAGGLTIAQVPGEAGQTGMPQSAVDTGAVDLVLPISEIPAAVERFARLSPEERAERVGETPEGPPADLQGRIAAILEARSDFDVRVYKPSTVQRRICRRMALAGFDDLDPYLEHLRDDEEEQHALSRDFLIGVTEFFRDPDAWEELRVDVIEPLVREAENGAVLRAWVPGCATGEEAYTLAMLLLEAVRAADRRLGVQVFATDLDGEALEVAREGVYPASVAAQVGKERLQAFFTEVEGRGFRVVRPLRDVVSFAVHDVTSDPPFSKMDLVSCRNLLIYLKRDTQEQVLGVLHFALKPSGALLLGPSESAGAIAQHFATLSKRWRIYRKVGRARPATVAATLRARTARREERAAGRPPRSREPDSADLARRALLDARVPPSVVVSRDGTVVYMHGDLDPYLRFPGGEPRFDLSSVVRRDLATRVRAAVYRCRRTGETAEAVATRDDARSRTRVVASPADDLGEQAVVVTFEELKAREAPEPEAGPGGSDELLVEQLEKELQATREDLRNTVEELETSNEELRSANEEASSMNEELQSSNEELEATSEELRSLNEELTTVNAQLREKVEEVESARDDLANFFASTHVATLFLDDELRLMRFTPTAGALLGLGAGDEGRPLDRLAGELLPAGLRDEAASVLGDLTPRERELRTGDGRVYVRRILPYLTDARRVAGVVVNLLEVTDLKRATDRLAVREQQQAVVAQLGLQALSSNDLSTFLEQAVRQVQATLGSRLCVVLEQREPGEDLVLQAATSPDAGEVGGRLVEDGPDSDAGFALSARSVVAVTDFDEERRFGRPALQDGGAIVSGLICAISTGEQPFGVLAAYGDERREYTPEEANFLQAVCHVVASAVSRMRSRRRIALEQGVGRILVDARDVRDAFPRLLNLFDAELGDVVAAGLWLAEEDGALRCSTVRAVGEGATSLDERELCSTCAGGRCLAFSAWETSRVVRLGVLPGGEDAISVESGARFGFAFPIRSGERLLGVVGLYLRRRPFSEGTLLTVLDAVGAALGEFVRRSQAELATARSEERLAMALAGGNLGAWELDLVRGGSWRSPEHDRLFGYQEALPEWTYEQFLGHVLPEDRETVEGAFRASVEEGKPLSFQCRIRRRDGALRWIAAQGKPYGDGEGPPQRMVGVVQDVTERKRVEEELRASEQALQEASVHKDRFIAMLGHELRNPLSVIRNAGELLGMLPEPDRLVMRARGILERQSAHMASILDGLLDVSRITRGKLVLDRAPTDLTRIVEQVISDRQADVDAQGHTLEVELPEEPLWLLADPVRLAQVTDNLLSNALKYTEPGGAIHVSLSRSGEHDALLTVRDTGIGIEPAFLEHVFTVFQQAPQDVARSRGGLGLGLALTKGIVELHGGQITLRSEGRGRGTEVQVRLPMGGEGPEVQEAKEAGSGEARRVLLVEDNAETADSLAELLRSRGHEVWEVHTGAAALEAVRQLPVEVVVCDIGLPEMSGYEVARAIRGDPELQRLRLVAVTGYGQPEDRARSFEAGFDAHLVKPVSLARLLETLG